MTRTSYRYRATPVRVIDGDTIECDVVLASANLGLMGVQVPPFKQDLGFHARIESDGLEIHLVLRLRFRFKGYNAPETRGPERPLGLEARDHLQGVLFDPDEPEVVPFELRSFKDDSFGRWLCDVIRQGESLVPQLLELGMGVAWDGRGKRPRFEPGAPYPIGRSS